MRAILQALGRALVTVIGTVMYLPFALFHAMSGGPSQRQQEAHETAWAFSQATENVTDKEREAANRRDAALAQKWCVDREMGRVGDLTGFKKSTQKWLQGLDQFERQVVGLAPPQAVRNHIAGFMHMRAIPPVDAKDSTAFRRQHKAARAEIESQLKAEVEAILDGRAPLPGPPMVA